MTLQLSEVCCQSCVFVLTNEPVAVLEENAGYSNGKRYPNERKVSILSISLLLYSSATAEFRV